MLWGINDNPHIYILYLICQSIFSDDGDIAFDSGMMLCLFPRCLNANKDVLLAEDFAGFEVDLFVCVEDGEVIVVSVVAIFVVLTEVGWVE